MEKHLRNNWEVKNVFLTHGLILIRREFYENVANLLIQILPEISSYSQVFFKGCVKLQIHGSYRIVVLTV